MEKPVLFVNACVRKESRTRRLAEKLLDQLGKPYEEICLEGMAFPVVDEDYLARHDQLISAGDFQDPMFDLARQFAEAETIVIAAPFWDLSFPATLKQYLEQISVVGITFRYSEDGVPIGLCRASRLFYVTTAGGPIFSEEYGYGYVKALARGFYGIQNTILFKAEGLDVIGADVERILQDSEKQMDEESLGS